MEIKGTNEQNMQFENYEIFKLATTTDENNNKTTKIVLGRWFIKEFETLEQAKEYIDKKPYELITSLVGIIYEHIINNKEIEEKQNEN